MILSDVFERFSQDAPLSVMAQGVMENALNPQFLDQLFEDVAQKQYTNKLLFSTIVDLMSVVVCRIRPSIHAAFQARAETVGATIDAVYDKLDGPRPPCRPRWSFEAARLTPVIDAMAAARADWLPGYRVRFLDGNHLPGSEHRLKELRTIRAGALPGHALVVLDPRLMLATDVVLCEDGHAQERSLLDRVLAIVAAKDLWIADRNFCTTDFLFGIARRDGSFVIRQHASTLHWEFVGKRRACGRIETGKVYEQTIRTTNDAGEVLILRRVTVLLDRPTRDGETELHLLTNVPAKGGRAQVIADLYRRRWTIETSQADCPSSGRWVGTRRIGYHRRDGVARTGRVVPATPGRTHRRRPHVRPPPDAPLPPRLTPTTGTDERPAAGVGAPAGRPAEATPRTARPTPRPAPRGHAPQGGRP